MHAIVLSPSGAGRASLQLLGRVCLVLLAPLLLLICSIRYGSAPPDLLWLGALLQLVVSAVALFRRRRLREPTSTVILLLYGIAFASIEVSSARADDWFSHLAQSILLLVPLIYFAVECLHESGAPALRRALRLAQQLTQRRTWPEKLHECRTLPEVKVLREAVQAEAGPALSLLADTRPEVRVTALAALESRQNWRPGQPQVVLQLAQRATEPEVRAAAINALADIEDRFIIEAVAEFLHDPSRSVRRTAAEALLRKVEKNWPWIRLGVRRALADPSCQDDGPLRCEGEQLTPEAVADLTAWTTEKGVQAIRATLTLGCHYHRLMSNSSDAQLVKTLRRQLADERTPALLRLELARVLYSYKELDGALSRQLINANNPAPLRLLAVEALMDTGQSAEAAAALHELARMSNREISLGVAKIVQERLGVDMGLPRDRPLPHLHSSEAAETARRVLVWATQQGENAKTALHEGEADCPESR